jgi:hypothetical protein
LPAPAPARSATAARLPESRKNSAAAPPAAPPATAPAKLPARFADPAPGSRKFCSCALDGLAPVAGRAPGLFPATAAARGGVTLGRGVLGRGVLGRAALGADGRGDGEGRAAGRLTDGADRATPPPPPPRPPPPPPPRPPRASKSTLAKDRIANVTISNETRFILSPVMSCRLLNQPQGAGPRLKWVPASNRG